ncbi:hypothetical protein T10_11150 [Trichinella papuae]|uniref:Uncharacterized protein n=2 Tax=Trichinella papuae TaxID=268474 RepID=A0A0V1MX69_9BILA|nr:hypothetical protein T10_11150 [Trichinella papuae]
MLLRCASQFTTCRWRKWRRHTKSHLRSLPIVAGGGGGGITGLPSSPIIGGGCIIHGAQGTPPGTMCGGGKNAPGIIGGIRGLAKLMRTTGLTPESLSVVRIVSCPNSAISAEYSSSNAAPVGAPPCVGFLQSRAICPAAPQAVQNTFAVTFGRSGHSQDLCVLAPQLVHLMPVNASSSPLSVPLSKASSRNCNFLNSFCDSGTSNACRMISDTLKKTKQKL